MLGRLLDPGRDHEHVTVGVGVDGTWTQGGAGERHGIEIRLVIVERGARAARMHPVGQHAQEAAKALERAMAADVLVGLFIVEHGSALGRAVALATVAVAKREGQSQFPSKIGA